MKFRLGFAALAAVGSLASAARAEDAKVIYGPDDRIDVYAATANEKSAASRTVALVSTSQLSTSDGGLTYNLSPTGATGPSQGWCASEPFYSQPSPAFCSGFLVGTDLIATAGHCINKAAGAACGEYSFVFDADMINAATARTNFPASSVYQCQEVVGGELGGADLSDWRVLRVNPVSGRTPLPIRAAAMGLIPNNEAVTVIGHPVGLPTKIAGGANVRNNAPAAYFVANLDTYGGNSGSAVFNAASIAAGAPLVEGILVRGETDFVLSGACYVSNVCPNTGCRGEDVTRAKEIEGALTNDSDGDGVPNASDNCPNVANPTQVDQDADGYGDACDCGPTNPNQNPGEAEIPGNGVDDDCNAGTPGGCPPQPQVAEASAGLRVDSQSASDLAFYLIPALALVAALRRRRA